MIKAIVILPLLVGLASCPSSRLKPTAIADSCSVLDETLYKGGTFSLSDAEIDALSESNSIKLDSVKRYYRRNCLAK